MQIKNYNLDRLDKYKLAFITIFGLVTLFTSEKDLLFQYYFRISSTTLFISIFIVFIILIPFNKKLSFDFISLILLARIVIYLIPLAFTETMEGYWGNYLTVIGTFLAYIISSQVSLKQNNNYQRLSSNILMIFLNLTSIQVIYIYFLLGMKYGTLNINLFKYYLVTPIGGSNYIASVILPLLIFVYYSDIKKKHKVISIILAIIALVIIQSKNAIFVLLIFLTYRFIKKYFRAIRGINENKKFALFLTVFLAITGSYILYFIFDYLLVKWNMGMVSSNGPIYEVINALSSNRLNVYSIELNRWTNHLIFGNGLAYELGTTRSHNWLIDLLVQSGLVGFFLYLSALMSWYKRVYLYKKSNKFIKAAYYAILVILIQGFAEVSVFTLTIDVLLWFFIGLSVSESKATKRNRLINQQ